MAGALPDHDGVGGLDAVHDAKEIDVEDVGPVGERVRVDLTRDADARVVEEVVDAAGAVDDLTNHALERGGVAHVEFDRVGPGAEPLRERRRLVELTVRDPDLGAVASQP